MAAVVGNLYRKLRDLAFHKPHPSLVANLQKVRILLKSLQGFLADAEWKRDLHDAEWRKGQGKAELYGQISKWVARVSALAAEVEDIIVSYDFHLCKIRSGSIYSKLQYYPFFLTSPDSVSAKIQRFLSKYPPPNNSTNGAHSYAPMPMKFSSEDDRVPLLNSPTDSYFSTLWPKGLLGMEMMEFFERFLDQVIQEIGSLSWDAISMQIASQPIGNVGSTLDAGKAIRTILESVNLIGRQKEEKQLECWLLEQKPSPPQVVIGVTGVPGIGKTTLVAAVYDRVKRDFDCHSWVFVPPSPTPVNILQQVLRGLLKSMSLKVPNNMDSLDEVTLKQMIHRRLTGRKLLLVLDDVPIAQDKEVSHLDYVKLLALPQDCKAKIICTSQKISLEYSEVLDLQKLSPQDAFHLLRKRACLGLDGANLWSSVKLQARTILDDCKGVPLAIATVGGMLSTKLMIEREWDKVRRKLMEASFVKSSFISLSYADLSPVLKSCFLYTSCFPSQYEISCKRLQRLWISEGLVQRSAEMTIEEVAKHQLEELIQRNMIQVARVGLDGCVETCRVLGPMREYALARCKQDQYFCAVLDNTEDDDTSMERLHRLFLHSEIRNVKNLNFGGVYSFVAMVKFRVQQPLLVPFKILSVLEIQEVPSDTLPNAIGDLVLLRYMSFRGTMLKYVPPSLKNLQRLETLDIRDTLVRDMPAGLESLGMLRNLLLAGSYSDNVVNIPVEIGLLKNLQTLCGLKLTGAIAKGLKHLPQLQKLSAGEVETTHSVNLLESIAQMKFLQSLTIKCLRQQKRIDMISCYPLYNLVKLRFGGPVHNLLHWVSKLHALKYLYLWDNMLTEDPFTSIQNLSKLVLLSLCNAYDGEELEFGKRGFLKLKKLSILHCRNLRQWTEIKDGAMGNLEMLTIAYCPKLAEPPKGLEKLKSLQVLQVSSMSEDFISRTRDIQLSSKFSLHVRDINQPTAAVKKVPATTSKGIRIGMPAYRITKMDPKIGLYTGKKRA